MSDEARVLGRLAAPHAVLAPVREGGFYGVYPRGDRRRRPVARLDAACVRALHGSGALAPRGDAFVLSEAGRARVRRDDAREGEQFAAQHAPIVDRTAIDASGDLRDVRGLEPSTALRRLAQLRDVRGAWLSGAELAAAGQLRED